MPIPVVQQSSYTSQEVTCVLARLKRSREGFTLVELLVVVVVLAVLGAIVIPKFVGAGKTSKEAALKTDLQILRNAIQMFYSDTGTYPTTLTDLAKQKSESPSGTPTASFDENDFKGPYILSIPDDPVYSPTTAPTDGNGEWDYTNTTGVLKSGATVVSTEGTAYNTW